MDAIASRLGSTLKLYSSCSTQAQDSILIALCHRNVQQTFSLVLMECYAAAGTYPMQCSTALCLTWISCCFAVDAPTPKHTFLEHLHCKTFHLQLPLIPQHKKAQALQNTSWLGLTGDPRAMNMPCCINSRRLAAS